MQVNEVVPPAISRGGLAPISLQVGNSVSQPGVTIAVR